MDDYAADTSTTGQLALNSATTGNIELLRDRDWFRIELAAGPQYIVRVLGSQSAMGTLADPYLYLYDSAGNLLHQLDDTGGHADPFLSFSVLQSGTYYVGVGAYADSLAGTYAVGVLTDDYSADSSTAAQVRVGGSITGNLERPADRDWIRVSLEAGHWYGFDLKGEPSGTGTLSDPYLYLYDHAGQLMVEEDDFGVTLESHLTYVAPKTGVYYLGVSGYADNAFGTYLLQVVGRLFSDVDGDGFNDVLFQSDASGQIFYERMVDGHAASGNYLTNPLGTLRAAGRGHVDPAVGSAADVLVQDVASGLGVFGVGPGGIYYYSHQDQQPWHVVAWSLEDDGSADPNVHTTSWTLGAVADVNGDGAADAVIQSTNKGAIYYMPMINGSPGAWGVASYDLRLADTPTSDYLRFVGAGDINADGFADVVVRNASDGSVYWGDMAGGAFTPPWHQVGTGSLGTGYQVIGVGDVNGDGHADVVAQLQLQGPNGLNGWTIWADASEPNPANIWKQVTNDASLRASDDHVALFARDVVDLNNDSFADVVFQDPATGVTRYWDVNPTTGNHFTDIGTVPGWHVI